MQDSGKVQPDLDAIIWALWEVTEKLFDLEQTIIKNRETIRAIENAVISYRDSHDATGFYSPWEWIDPNDDGYDPEGREDRERDLEEER